MKTKVCSVCKLLKPLTSFGKHAKEKGGLRGQCKTCHSSANCKFAKTEGSKSYRFNARMRNRIYIYGILQKSKCKDCSENRWQVLEFDHVKGKKLMNIACMTSSSYSLATIQKEIDKCEVRCANCHKLKTMNQLGFYKDDWETKSKIVFKSPARKKTVHRGERHHACKLTLVQVIRIRKEYIRGKPNKLSLNELALKYGVSRSTIEAIVDRRIWKDV